MLPKKLVFVDLETTGTSATRDRIIEIGILRVEDGKVVKTFQSLINPDYSLPPEITVLTGITSENLEAAPSFYQLHHQILELLEGCVFVAHNVRFDYSFLRNEFKRLGKTFTSKQICTVKLSRSLFPRHTNHDLSTLIERFDLKCSNRHRAFDDAKVIWDFYQLLQKQIPEKLLEKAVDLALKKPTLPIKLQLKDLENLPESPGVYIFYGANGVPLYIGKSVNIRDRVMSHFSSDHASGIEMKIAQTIESIDTVKTSGELGALLLESALIKRLQPLYNRMLRHSRKLVVVKEVMRNDFLSIELTTLEDVELGQLNKLLGIFKSIKQAKQFLLTKAKEHNLCEKLLGLEATKGGCFALRLGKCHGGCVNKELPQKYNLRFIEAFIGSRVKPWPFSGPIIIEEENPLEETKEAFLIDQWCYIGSLKSDQLVPEVKQQPYFDVDSYKILNRFLKSAKNLKAVKQLSYQQFKDQGRFF